MRIEHTSDGKFRITLEAGAGVRGAVRLQLAAQGYEFTETKAFLGSVFAIGNLTRGQVQAVARWIENVQLSGGPAAGELGRDGLYTGMFTAKGRRRATLEQVLIDGAHQWCTREGGFRTTTYVVVQLSRSEFYALRSTVLRLNKIEA